MTEVVRIYEDGKLLANGSIVVRGDGTIVGNEIPISEVELHEREDGGGESSGVVHDETSALEMVKNLLLGKMSNRDFYPLFDHAEDHPGYYHMFVPLAQQKMYDMLRKIFPKFLPSLSDSVGVQVREVPQEIRREIMNAIVDKAHKHVIFEFLQWLPITEKVAVYFILNNTCDGMTEKVFDIIDSEPDRISPLDECIKHKSYLIDKAIINVHGNVQDYIRIVDTINNVFDGEWDPRWLYSVIMNNDFKTLYVFNEIGCKWPPGTLEMIAKYSHGLEPVTTAIEHGVPIENENKSSSPADYIINNEEDYYAVLDVGLNITYNIVSKFIKAGADAEFIGEVLRKAREDCGISVSRESRILIEIAETREDLLETAIYEWGFVPTWHLFHSKNVNMKVLEHILGPSLMSVYRK